MRRIAVLCVLVVAASFAVVVAEEILHVDPSSIAGGQYRIELNRLNEKVLKCYSNALAQQPQAAGQIKVRILIEPTGAMRSSTILDDTLRVPAVTQCLTGLLANQHWPKNNMVVEIIYTFRFAATAAPAPTPASAAPPSAGQ